MRTSLFRIIQPVTDIDVAARFYGTVFSDPGERVSAGRHYFDCEGTILACYDPVADGDAVGEGWRHHALQYAYFAVEDLEAMESRVRDAGGEITAGIATKPWGERIFYARDPAGNPIAFVDAETVFRGSSRDE